VSDWHVGVDSGPDSRERLRHRQLPWGGRVLEMERPGCGVVSLQIWIPAGSLMEVSRPGSGIAHFLEHMVFKGTARRSASEINLQAERLGGYLNAYTSYDRTVYHIDLPSENAVEALDLLTDFVWNPTLPEEGFEPEREVILREMALYRDDPDSHLFDSMMEAAFREDLLRFPVIGLEDRFKALTLSDLRKFHATNYACEQTTLLLAGDLPQELLEKAQIILPRSQVDDASVAALRSHEREDPAPVRLRLQGDWEGSRGALLFVVPTATPEERSMAEWVIEVLAGGESSLLNRIIRQEKGLVHFFDGYLYAMGPISLMGFSWLSEEADLDEVEEVLMNELARLGSTPISAEELERGRKRFQFLKWQEMETVDGWAAGVGESFAAFGALVPPAEEARLVHSFSSDHFQEFAKKYLSADKAMTGRLQSGENA